MNITATSLVSIGKTQVLLLCVKTHGSRVFLNVCVNSLAATYYHLSDLMQKHL